MLQGQPPASRLLTLPCYHTHRSYLFEYTPPSISLETPSPRPARQPTALLSSYREGRECTICTRSHTRAKEKAQTVTRYLSHVHVRISPFTRSPHHLPSLRVLTSFNPSLLCLSLSFSPCNLCLLDSLYLFGNN